MSTESNDHPGQTLQPAAPGVVKPVSRRMLMRGAAAVVPTILTLNSPVAAAVARTSNDMSLAYDADVDGLKRKLCVDLQTTPAPVHIEGSRYDLGDPPTARVTAIPTTNADGAKRVYLAEGKNNALEVAPQDMCANGGTYYYEVPKGTGNATEFKAVNVPRGMMASVTALSSYSGSGNISIKEI
jgi:hypothetical protein